MTLPAECPFLTQRAERRRLRVGWLGTLVEVLVRVLLVGLMVWMGSIVT